MINEAEWHQTRTRAWLESWIEQHEISPWLSWFISYPAKSSVEAAKSQLKAMDDNLLISTADSFEIFKE